MAESQEGFLNPKTVLEQLKKNGVTHVLWLPDLSQADQANHLHSGSLTARACATCYPRRTTAALPALETVALHRIERPRHPMHGIED